MGSSNVTDLSAKLVDILMKIKNPILTGRVVGISVLLSLLGYFYHDQVSAICSSLGSKIEASLPE